jgi:hypothetical protein
MNQDVKREDAVTSSLGYLEFEAGTANNDEEYEKNHNQSKPSTIAGTLIRIPASVTITVHKGNLL